MKKDMKLGITIYISGIIILVLLLLWLSSMNHTIIVKTKIVEIKGADNYIISGNEAIIVHNGNTYKVELVHKINTLGEIIGFIRFILIMWIVVGALIVYDLKE